MPFVCCLQGRLKHFFTQWTLRPPSPPLIYGQLIEGVAKLVSCISYAEALKQEVYCAL